MGHLRNHTAVCQLRYSCHLFGQGLDEMENGRFKSLRFFIFLPAQYLATQPKEKCIRSLPFISIPADWDVVGRGALRGLLFGEMAPQSFLLLCLRSGMWGGRESEVQHFPGISRGCHRHCLSLSPRSSSALVCSRGSGGVARGRPGPGVLAGLQLHLGALEITVQQPFCRVVACDHHVIKSKKKAFYFKC